MWADELKELWFLNAQVKQDQSLNVVRELYYKHYETIFVTILLMFNSVTCETNLNGHWTVITGMKFNFS